jgi:hypothetical protein
MRGSGDETVAFPRFHKTLMCMPPKVMIGYAARNLHGFEASSDVSQTFGSITIRPHQVMMILAIDMGIERYFRLPSPAPSKMSNSLPDLNIGQGLDQHRPLCS